MLPNPQNDMRESFSQAVNYHRQGLLVEAEALYRVVIEQEPRNAEAWHLLGALSQQLGQSQIALDCIDRALVVDPDNGHFHYSRGVSLQNLDRPHDAVDAYRASLQQSPQHLESLENLAVALTDAGDGVEGERTCREVLDIAPDSEIARRNLATLLIQRGQREDALEHLDMLLAANPADASAHAKRAQILLALGRFDQGYADHDWRHHSPDFGDANVPRLLPLASLGKRSAKQRKLVVLPEQGVGDEILFAAGVPAMAAEASKLVLYCDPRLTPLFSRSFPNVDVRPAPSARECRWPADVDAEWLRCEAGDLPQRAFAGGHRMTAPYLRPDPDRVRYWRERFAERSERTIGIAWRGGADPRAQDARSTSLKELQPLVSLPNTRVVSLQYRGPDHDPAVDIRAFNAQHTGEFAIEELAGVDTTNDFDELAAICAALTCVVTIDSAIAHLAAACGAETHVLLPPASDWRWFEEGMPSPWYCRVRTWRRRNDEGWRTVVDRLVDALPARSEPLQAPAKTVARARTASDPDVVRKRKILLLNDTSAWYHWGCSCTSIALNEGLRAQTAGVHSLALLRDLDTDQIPRWVEAFDSPILYKRFRRGYPWIVDAIRDADRVVINGEGTLHGLGQQAVGLLYLAWLAMDRLRRPVDIVNHSVYPLDATVQDEQAAVAFYHRVYDGVRRSVVRESMSHEVMGALGIPSTLGFDCLPLFVAAHGPKPEPLTRREKRVVVAGSVQQTGGRAQLLAPAVNALMADGYRVSLLLGARGLPATDDAYFAATLSSAVDGELDVVLATSEHEWLEEIAKARLLVSGRFHHSIAAACLQTPFVALASNTPKINGLMHHLSMQAALPRNATTVDDDSDALLGAIQARLSTPEDYVLDGWAIARLRELARENF